MDLDKKMKICNTKFSFSQKRDHIDISLDGDSNKRRIDISLDGDSNKRRIDISLDGDSNKRRTKTNSRNYEFNKKISKTRGLQCDPNKKIARFLQENNIKKQAEYDPDLSDEEDKESTHTYKKYDFSNCGLRQRKHLDETYKDKREIDFFYKYSDYEFDALLGTIINVYGLNFKDEATIQTRITGFYPNFYIEKNPIWTIEQIDDLFLQLDYALRKGYGIPFQDKDALGEHDKYFISYEIEKASEYELRRAKDISHLINPDADPIKQAKRIEDSLSEYIKIYVSHPKLVSACRELLSYPLGGKKATLNRNFNGGDGGGGEDDNKKSWSSGWNTQKEYTLKNIPSWGEDLKIPLSYTQDKYGEKRSNIRIFEADVDFIIRFLTDNHFEPSSWFTIPQSKYSLIGEYSRERNSSCELEILVNYKNMNKCTKIEIKDTIPDFTSLGLDFEVQTSGKRFPHFSIPIDRILQAGIVLSTLKFGIKKKFVFTLKETDSPDPDVTVFYFPTEKKLIEGLVDFIKQVDPDVLIHYNGNYFDFPYLFGRADLYKVFDAYYIGRSKVKRCYVTSNVNKGIHKSNLCIPGRWNIDVLRRVQEDEKFDDNSLGNASNMILSTATQKITKEEFDVNIISRKQRKKATRKGIAKYVLKDAILPVLIVRKRKITESYIKRSRERALPFQTSIDRSNEIGVIARLKQECFPPGGTKMLKLTEPVGKKVKYKGATVIDAISGFWKGFTLVFDFSGMYNSIIQLENLCHSTYVSKEIIKQLGLIERKHYRRQPDRTFVGDETIETYREDSPCFLLKSIKEGILPRLERELGATRNEIKKQMNAPRSKSSELLKLIEETENHIKGIPFAEQTIEFKTAKEEFEVKLKKLRIERDDVEFDFLLLNLAQDAKKLLGNVIYGITGFPDSSYYQPHIAGTVTATGRWLIQMMMQAIHKKFKKEKGYPFDAKVIYGDTDSVFVYAEGVTRQEAFSIGYIIQKYLNEKLKEYPPTKIEFEKIIENLNLIMAKNYNGIVIMPSQERDKFTSKGIRYEKRGPTPFAKETAKKAAELIAKHGNTEKALEYVKERKEMLLKDEIIIGHLIEKTKLSKALKKYGTKSSKNAETDEVTIKKVSDSPGVTLAKKIYKETLLGTFISTINESCKQNSDAFINNPFHLEKVFTTESDYRICIRTFANDKEESIEIDNHKIGEYAGYVSSLAFACDNICKHVINEWTEVKLDISEYKRNHGFDITFSLPFNVTSEKVQTQVKAGDFVNYVVVRSDTKSKKISSKVEDPFVAMTNQMPLDYHHYLESLNKILLKVFAGPLGYGIKEGTPPEKLLKKEIDNKSGKVKWVLSAKQKREITKAIHGVEMIKDIKINNTILKTSALYRHLKPLSVCINCSRKIDNKIHYMDIDIDNGRGGERDNRTLCSDCRNILPLIIKKQFDLVDKCKTTKKESWGECEKCLDTKDMEELNDCTSMTCPNNSIRDRDRRLLEKAFGKLSLLTGT